MLVLGGVCGFNLQGSGKVERTGFIQDYLYYQGLDKKVYLKYFTNYKV